jgi:glycogen debranching enzyme
MPPQDKKLSSNLIIQVEDQFYILATSSLVDQRTRVLKHDETFTVLDRYGDVHAVGSGEQGLYHEGTRHVSRLVLTINGERPLLLSSATKDDNAVLTVDLTNNDLYTNNRIELARGSLHFFRSHFLLDGCWYQHLRLRNYGLVPYSLNLAFQWEADFSDIFEVRGVHRQQRGKYLEAQKEKDGIILSYRGLDKVIRRTLFHFSPAANEINESGAVIEKVLKPMEQADYYISIGCSNGDFDAEVLDWSDAWNDLQKISDRWKSKICEIETSNPQCNILIRRCISDIGMMITENTEGSYPFAGVPWYSTHFGRDGIITAMECLWLYPALAKGVLTYLSNTQAREVNEFQDAQPGKILHERRKGEMAALKEIPFGSYYGSVDATPLFIMLAGNYLERTGDLKFLQSIWPNILLAMNWIDHYGDPDGDGFVEYYRRSPTGLVNQGWKDSGDSIFHEDGTLAQGPIALCEVQAYVYAAKRCAAQVAEKLGYEKKAAEWFSDAEALRDKFQETFWLEDLGMYAIALDGEKKPCRVRTSNAGHALFTGIASRAHARKLADLLVSEEMFSGFGIRTLGMKEARYNPMSYHNGSVWPHDNAMIAHGMNKYGFKEEAIRLMNGLYETSLFLDLYRIPELFCGFERRAGEAPVEYPVACAPQSWSAASIFMMLQACLGMSIHAEPSRITFDRPHLPEFIREIRLCEIQVGQAKIDLLLERYQHDVGITILRKTGQIAVMINK